MPHRCITTTDKQRLFHAHNGADGYVVLAHQLGTKRAATYAIILRAQRNHDRVALAREDERQRRQVITPELTKTAIEIVEQHVQYAVDQIERQVRLALPNQAHIGRSTLSNLLRRQLFVVKKLQDVPHQKNRDTMKKARSHFAQ